MRPAPWADRQQDFANLFNPAFVAIVLQAACAGYSERAIGGMPYPVAFIVVPLVLNPAVQSRLPGNANARLGKWLRDNPDLKSETVGAAKFLVPLVREAIEVGADTELLSLSGPNITASERHNAWSSASKVDGITPHIRAANFVGRWLACSGREADLFLQFGVRP